MRWSIGAIRSELVAGLGELGFPRRVVGVDKPRGSWIGVSGPCAGKGRVTLAFMFIAWDRALALGQVR